MFFESGQIQKLKIHAYSDSTYPAGQEVATFEVQVNPETITRKMSVTYAEDSNPGEGQQAIYFNTNPEEFRIDILLDATGVVKDAGLLNIAVANPFAALGDENDITRKVTDLKNCLYYVAGDTHRPYFVKIFYGTDDLTFQGAMTSLDIDYKLFTPDGKPLRAIAHLTLRSSIDPAAAAAQADTQSPDITHQRTFKADSQFALMSDEIYKDVNRYIDVAKANKLLSFRKIETGTPINFPPVK
jgi:hypothetical protein